MYNAIRALILLLALALPAAAQFPTLTGRIAISSDGNNHDCDDIAATPMTITLLARTGNASKLVYYGHSDHHWSSDTVESCGPGTTDREAVMADSVEDTIALWGGFSAGIVFNASANLSGSVAALTARINESSAGNPLYIIAAGPMDVVGQALAAAGANKDHVTVISHSTWNDDHADNPEGGETSHSGWTWTEMQAANPTVTFTHITDQNPGLNVNESNYSWLQNSYDARLRWLWDRHVTSGETPFFDPSDAGMLYWLLSGGGGAGDEGATPRKMRFVLEPNIYPAQNAAWDTATPAEMGFNAGAFATALAALPTNSIVIRNGYVVGTKGTPATTGFIWSASKSLVALMFGRQLQLDTVQHDQLIAGSDFPSAPQATYRQFLNMTSDYGLSPHSPGNNYAYNNGGLHHVGTHIKTTFHAGRTHAQALQDSYVTALGFEDTLDYPATTFAGDNFMSGWNGGWSMSTRDLARIAYLVLREGNWKGQQLISAPFIANLYILQIPGSATFSTDTDDLFFNQHDAIGSNMNQSLTYCFWKVDPVNGGPPSSDVTAMFGAFGTSAYISRIHNLVVVNVNSGGTTTNPSDRISGAEFDAVVNSIANPTFNPPTTCGWSNSQVCR